MLIMSVANALQDSNSKAIETTFQPAFIVGTSEKKDSLRILHVDDDQGFLEASKQILTMDNNFEIEAASSVDEAFQKMEKQTYDAIVSDYEMPLKNGLDFLKELRQQQRDLPFILFTGKGREEVAVKALNLGADSYINKNGSPETVYGELADAINKTVERKKTRKSLVESESKYRMLVEKSLQGIIIAQGAPPRIAFANASMGKILGYSFEEFTSFSPSEVAALIHHEDRTVFFNRFRNRLEGKQAHNSHEFRAVRKDGSIVWMEAFATLIEYNGQPALQAMFLDINERKKAEEDLRESEESFLSLIDSMDDLVFILGLDGTYKNYYQPSHRSELIAAPEEFIGKHFPDVLPPHVADLFQAAVKRIEASGETQEFDYYLEMNGKKLWYNARLSPTKDPSGQKTSVVAVVRNITERKKMEESLEKEQQELNRIIDSSPIIIFYKDKEGKIIRVNKTLSEALKIPKQKFPGKTAFDIYPAEIAREMANDDLAVLQSGHPRLGIIQQYKSASGMRWVQTDKVPILDENGVSTGLIGFAQDITERKKAEEALKESETKFRMYMENSPVAVFVSGSEGKYQYVNEAASRLLGYSTKELLSMAIPQIVFEEELPATLNDFANFQETGKMLKEARLKNKDGQAVYVILNAVKLPNGKLIAFCENITERKRAEESLDRMLNELVSVNEKLGVVGSLTRHDARNKLSVINGNIFLLKKKHSDCADMMDRLGAMEQACNSVVKIFDFAKMYEQLGVEELSFINVEKTIDEAVALFSGSLNVKIINECNGLTVLADSFLRQLFYNLIDNSIKHGKRVTKITVHFERANQDNLNLIYEDDGIGVSEQNKLQLFHEGFSTSGLSGYGLYLIRKMMEVYGWAIQENGEPDKGAKFTITIPKINQEGKENFQIA